MLADPPASLRPRKKPRQARSAATVESIFQATIQVLLTDGVSRLTTTRVAERAGVSVGTMYQYFPHKEALLYAVLQRQFDLLAEDVESACRHYEGQSLAVMSDALVSAYLDAKTRHIETSRALYAVASEFDTAVLVDEITRRLNSAMVQLFSSASDAKFSDLGVICFAVCNVLCGAVRATMERGATPVMLAMLRNELPLMCRSYLSAVAGQGPDQRVVR